MTDITKYKNVSLSHKTYDLIDKIRKVIQPDTVLSRSQTISILVNEKARKLNGQVKKKRLKLSVLYVKVMGLLESHTD